MSGVRSNALPQDGDVGKHSEKEKRVITHALPKGGKCYF